MFSKAARRSLLVTFVLTLFVLPGVAQAGAFDPAGERSLPLLHGFQQQVENWAGLLWGNLSGLWEKEGGSIDPNGAPKPGGTGAAPTGGTTSGSGGTSVDPSGTP
jgi:hypothetical protein